MRTLLFLTLCSVALAQPNEPLLSLALNGSAEAQALQGSPLVLELSVLHARATKIDKGFVPIGIAARDGTGWPNALEVRVTNDRGEEQAWPFALVTPTESPLTLDGTNAGELIWVLKPQDAANLPEGAYEIAVSVDSAKAAAATGWSGRKRSPPVTLRISAEPSPLSDEQGVQKNLLLARYYSLAGDREQALAMLNKVLDAQPDNIAALENKGDLLAGSGDDEAALGAYAQAVAAFYRANGRTAEPPRALLQKQGSLFVKWLDK